MPDTSINALRKQVAQLEREQARAREEAQLKKKIKQMQFRKSTFGKVTGGIGRFGEGLTRPVQKTKEGKVIAGTGGFGSRMVEGLKRMTAPKPRTAVPKQAIRRMQMQPQPMMQPQMQTSALDMFADWGGSPAPARTMQKVRKKAPTQQKPFDVNDIIRSLPA